MGLGNKANGGRINRLFRGRRRRQWFTATTAVVLGRSLKQLGGGPPAYFASNFGAVAGEPFDGFTATQGGPIAPEAFDSMAATQGGPITPEGYDAPQATQGGPLDPEGYDAPQATQGGPIAANDLYAEATTAFPAPARSLVPGRAYTRGQSSNPQQLSTSQTLDLTLPGGSFQLASLPATSGDVLFTQVELECTAGAGITVDAVVTVTDQDGNVIVPATTLTNFRSAGNVFSLVATGKTHLVQQQPTGGVLLLLVNTPASTGTLQAVAHVVGFAVA